MADQEVDLLAEQTNTSAAEIVLAAASQQEDGEINTSNEQEDSSLLDQSGDVPAVTTTAPDMTAAVQQVTPAMNQQDIQESNNNGEEYLINDDENQRNASADSVEDTELNAIKERVRQMEAEAERLKEMQQEVEQAMNPGLMTPETVGQLNHSNAPPPLAFPSLEEKIDADSRSIYGKVGQVEYTATAEEVEAHFRGCGGVNRVTIICDKFSGHPKGFGYIEFADKESVETAMALDGSLLKGRSIKVMPKRTNKPGITLSDRARARGRGRGRGRGMRGGPGGPMRGRGAARGAFQAGRGGFPY